MHPLPIASALVVSALCSTQAYAAQPAEGIEPARQTPRKMPQPQMVEIPTEPTTNPAIVEPDTQFDGSFDLYVAPGVLNVPYAGEDEIDYATSFDPGYQWGFGLGYFARGDSPLALGVGAFFDHALINSEISDLTDDVDESIFRVGLELRPGVVVGESVFFTVPLRGGYTADVAISDDDTDVSQGAVFGVGAGLDVAIYRGFYLGTVVGTDLHFFRKGADANAYLFAWRLHAGYRF